MENDLGVSLPGHQGYGGDATVTLAVPACMWCGPAASWSISRKRLLSLLSASRLMLRMPSVMPMYRRCRTIACGVVMRFLIGDVCANRSVTIVNTSQSMFSFGFVLEVLIGIGRLMKGYGLREFRKLGRRQ